MKTNIKLRVTPEQSKRVQEICFENKIFWIVSGNTFCDYTLIYIKPNVLVADADHEDDFEEIDADLFIRTNGTCVEDKKEIDLRNTWCYSTMPNHIKLRLLGFNPEPIGCCKSYYYIDCNNNISDLDTPPKLKPDHNEIKLNEQCKFEIITCDEEGLLVKAFGKEYILEPEEIEVIQKSLSKYPSSKLSKLKPYSKISQESECQFAKYGFEKPDFECELFGTVSGPFEKDDFVVGVIKKGMFNNCPHMWSVKHGTCYTSSLA